MGQFKHKPIPERWAPRWLWDLVTSLQTAINALSEVNFPSPLDGDTVVAKNTMDPNRLMYGEWVVGVLLALSSSYTTTSTVLVAVGPLLYFDKLRWPYAATSFYLEITAGPGGVGGNTVVELHDATGAVASQTVTVVGQGRYRVQFSRLPTNSETLQIKIRTTNGAVTAGITGASVVCRPA